LLDIQLPKIERVASTEAYARYRVEPLERGFGMTLGNAMRRVLLSSLTGAAVTAIRIDSVYHEFAPLPHVKEDVTEIILNLKQLRLRSFTDYPARLTLEAKGIGRVTGADIICPPEVEVANPELHIATLDDENASLVIELTVEKGKGFVPAEAKENNAIGVIPIDAIFTPVRRVNYIVENTRVGHQTDYDRLQIEIWTDGTITPDDAVAQSAEILLQHVELLAGLGGRVLGPRSRVSLGAAGIPAEAYDIPIEELELSVRAYNCLKRAGISKVGQVLEMTDDDILAVRNFGRKSLDELREKLASRGFIQPSEATSEGSDEEEELEDEVEPEALEEEFEEETRSGDEEEPEAAVTEPVVVPVETVFEPEPIETIQDEAIPIELVVEPVAVPAAVATVERGRTPAFGEDDEEGARRKARRPKTARRGRRKDDPIVYEEEEEEY
jgi:DNA-directed RNA polymerase subunit alpha